MSELEILLGLVFVLIALLYSAVGHAGGTGYLIAMTLAGVAPDQIRPFALTVNVLVGAIGVYRFGRAGYIKIPKLLPFVFGSVPTLLLASRLHLTSPNYTLILGVLILAAAMAIFAQAERGEELDARAATSHLPTFTAFFAAVCIGLFAATGTGVAIVILTPLILIAGWMPTREACGTSVALIWLHSLIMVAMMDMPQFPAAWPYWMVAAAVGAIIGTHLSIRKLSVRSLRWILGIILAIAAARLLFLT